MAGFFAKHTSPHADAWVGLADGIATGMESYAKHTKEADKAHRDTMIEDKKLKWAGAEHDRAGTTHEDQLKTNKQLRKFNEQANNREIAEAGYKAKERENVQQYRTNTLAETRSQNIENNKFKSREQELAQNKQDLATYASNTASKEVHERIKRIREGWQKLNVLGVGRFTDGNGESGEINRTALGRLLAQYQGYGGMKAFMAAKEFTGVNEGNADSIFKQLGMLSKRATGYGSQQAKARKKDPFDIDGGLGRVPPLVGGAGVLR